MRFDLNRHVARWRHDLARRAAFDDAHLDELEAHLWDEIERLQADGLDERQAFLRATVRLGHADALAHEFHKATVWGERPRWQHPFWQLMMGKNYLTVAWRNLRKERAFSVINIGGLALGLACCLLMLLFVQHERSYDRFHTNAANLYRANLHTQEPGGTLSRGVQQPAPLGPALAEAFDAVVRTARLKPQAAVVQAAHPEPLEETILFTDAAFFEMFSFPLRRGTAASVFAQPNSLVLSESRAKAYFGSADPVGLHVRVSLGGAFETFTVTGVVDDPPTASSIDYSLLAPLPSLPHFAQQADDWSGWGFPTYVQLADDADPVALAEALPPFVAQHYAPMINTWQVLGWLAQEEGALQVALQPLTDVHLAPEVVGGLRPAREPQALFGLAALALAILLVACINFTALAVGRATRRAREVGLRKALGAGRGDVQVQFWSEAALATLLALVVGLGGAYTLLPAFEALAETPLSLAGLLHGWEGAALLGLVLLVAGVAGSYPALYLARLPPSRIFRAEGGPRAGQKWLHSLVVLQFGLSIFFVATTFGVSAQLHFLQEKDLGFADEQVVAVPLQGASADEAAALKQEVQRFGGVTSVAGASAAFHRGLAWKAFTAEAGVSRTVYVNDVDPDYLGTLGMTLAEGRDFSAARRGDVDGGVLVNEALVEEFGWADPVGKTLTGFHYGREVPDPVVVGVVEDFHYTSLHEPIRPLVLTRAAAEAAPRHLFVRVHPGHIAPTLDAVAATWQRILPERPFRYTFLDDAFAQQYRAERQIQRLVGGAALLALVIACLGLFGLVAFSVARRRKEIGVRKVLGASVPALLGLLAKDFLRLVGVAFVLAAPLAYLALDAWLSGFAYQAAPGFGPFLLAGIITFSLATLTLSYQTLRAALADPVEALRRD